MSTWFVEERLVKNICLGTHQPVPRSEISIFCGVGSETTDKEGWHGVIIKDSSARMAKKETAITSAM